jgi:hypothetical protein
LDDLPATLDKDIFNEEVIIVELAPDLPRSDLRVYFCAWKISFARAIVSRRLPPL